MASLPMADASQLGWLEHFKIERDTTTSSSRRRQVDNWVRGEMIGAGSFSEVYVESNNKTNKYRAVKEIRKRSQRQDLKSELLALTRLSRRAYEEHFVRFLGWYDDHWTISLIMEYFELGDLRKHIGSPLPEPQAREITLQLFLGLQAMHKDGITHRDLKPDNIFVVSKDPWHIKIGDFGISKRVLDNETFLRTVEIGTRSYMAPEVLELLPQEFESSIYHNTVDIWAGGIILYELLCAAKPFFRSRSLSEYCFGQRELPTVALESQGVSEAGIALIERLLQVVPSDRPDADIVLEAEWFDTKIRQHSQDRIASPASASDTEPTVSSASQVSHHSSLSNLPERKYTTARTSKTAHVHSEAERNKPQASSGRRAPLDQVAGEDQSDGEFGQTDRRPPLATVPPAATIVASTLGQASDSNNLETIRKAILPQESTKEIEAVKREDILVPWTEDEIFSTGLSEAPQSKFDLNEDETKLSPWRKYPLKFPETIDDVHHLTLRRASPAACVSDSNVAFVIGGEVSEDQKTKQPRDTWKLIISNEDILCTPVEARDLPLNGGWAGMIDNTLVYIGRKFLSRVKLFSLDQVQGAWRERRGSLESGVRHQYCTFGRNLVMYKEIEEKSWRNIARELSRYRWYFEIHTMDLSKITSVPPPPWKLSIRRDFGGIIREPRNCAMIEYRQSVIIFGADSIPQFDPVTTKLDALPMPRLNVHDEFYAVAVIGDIFYVYSTWSRGGELFALHIPTGKWRRLKCYFGGAKWRKNFTLLAMGTRLMLFGGDIKKPTDDYVTRPNGDRTECVWVLDTAEDLKWEDHWDFTGFSKDFPFKA